MNKEFAFVKYIDYFNQEHFEIWNREEYGINLVLSTILFQSDDYKEVDNFRNNYHK